MDKKSAIAVVRFLAETLQNQGLQVDKAILFGSMKRDEGHSESDIDVAIVSPDFSDKDVFERAALMGVAESKTIRRFQIPLDVIFLSPEEYAAGDSFAALFAQEGESIAFSFEKSTAR